MALSENSCSVLDARFLEINGAEPLSGFPMGAPDGSVASPSYAFEVNSGTGLSLISDNLTFGVNGVSGLVVGMDGNVAIGGAPSDYGITTPGEGVLFMNNVVTQPTSAPNGGSGGGMLHVDGNSLKYTDSNGSTIDLASKTGDVLGPVSSALNSVVVFDGVTGKLIQDSFLLATDSSTLQGPDGSDTFNTFTFTGDEDTGLNRTSGSLNIVNGGSPQLQIGSTVDMASGVESLVPDGTVGAPAYSFTSSPTSGIFLSGTDVNFSTGGVTGLVVEDVGGAVPNVAFAGSAPSNYGVTTPGVGVLFLPEATTVPSGIPNMGSGSVLYVSGSELLSLNSAGVTRDLTNCAEETSGTTTLNGVVRFSGTTGKIIQDTSTLTVDSNGQWAGPDGALATTTYGFTGDPNTGMFSSGANVVDLATNGISQFSVESAFISVDNPMFLPNGTRTAPAYSFTSAPTTGVYYDSSTDMVCFSAGGDTAFAASEENNIAFGGEPVDSFGGGNRVWWLRQATVVPSTNPSSGSLLYTDSTELYLRTPSGTVFNLTDEITGPGSATDEALVIFSGTTGKVVQNSLVTGTDAGRLNSGDGSVSNPAYSFTSDVDTGLYISGTDVYLTAGGGVGGVGQLLVDGSTVSSAAPFLVPYGTASTPSMTFTGDTNTGLYHGFTNRVTASVGGSVGLSMDVAGLGTNVSLTGTSTYGGGQNVVFMEEVGVVPVGTLPSGGILYVSGTDLIFHDDTGSTTTLNSSPTSFIDGPLTSVVDSVAFWNSTNGTTFNSGTVAATSTQVTATGYYAGSANTDITNDTSRLTFSAGTGNSLLVGSGGVEVTGIPFHADDTLRIGGGSGVSESLSGSVYTSNHLNAAGTFEWQRNGSQIFATSGLNVTTGNSYVFPNSTELLDIGNTSGTTYTVASTSSGTPDNISLSVDGTTRVLFDDGNSLLGNATVFPTERTGATTQFEAGDGSIASPAYTFDSAPTSGMLYDSTTSSVGFSCDGKLSTVVSDATTDANLAFCVSAFPSSYNGGVRVVYIGEVITEPTSNSSGITSSMFVSAQDDLRFEDDVTNSDMNSTLNSAARRALITLNLSPSSGQTVDLVPFVWTDVDSAGVSGTADGNLNIPSVDTTVMVIFRAEWASNSTGYRRIAITTTGSFVVEATSTVNAVNGDVTAQTVTLIRRIGSSEANLNFQGQVFQNSGGSLNGDFTLSLVRMN